MPQVWNKTLVMWLAVPPIVLAFCSVCNSAPLMVERNLFAQDRRPPTETVAAAPQRSNTASLSPKSLQLDGVFIHGDVKEALLRVKGHMPGKAKGKNESPFVRVREGEKIADYQVVKIESRSVSLEKDGQVFVVNLFAEGKIVPPAPHVPPAAGATPEASTAAPGAPGPQGTMRLPHPVPPAGRGNAAQNPAGVAVEQGQQDNEESVSQDVNSQDEESAPDEEDQSDEDIADDSGS